MFEQIVREIEIQGYSINSAFISAAELAGIQQFFQSHLAEFLPALIGKGAEKKRIESIRGDFTMWLDPLNTPGIFRPLFDSLDKIQMACNQKLFLGMKEYECHLAFYPAGAYYAKHLDRFAQSSSRVLSFVFYLHSDWDAADGGELVLYDKSDKEILKLTPEPGTFVCFLSDEFPHEVRTARKERRSLTGWMHTKIIN